MPHVPISHVPMLTDSYYAGTNRLVYVNSQQIYYYVTLNPSRYPCVMTSSDRGMSWNFSIYEFLASSVSALAVWHSRWSNVSSDLIHIVAIDQANSDVCYWSLNPAVGIGTKYTVFAGTSYAAGSCLSITQSRNGTLFCCGQIDAGTEIFAKKSTDGGVNWSDISAVMESATQDQIILMPGWNADTDDIQCFYWDASADEISVKRYDYSGNSWAETSIATSMVDTVSTSSFPHFDCAVDLTNSQNVLVAWSAVDSANADLRCWTIDDSNITEKTNVVLNSTDDQGLCAISIRDDSIWDVYYSGNSSGSETFSSNVSIRFKSSTDSGTTWGTETEIKTSNNGNYCLRGCMIQANIGVIAFDYLNLTTTRSPWFCYYNKKQIIVYGGLGL